MKQGSVELVQAQLGRHLVDVETAVDALYAQALAVLEEDAFPR